MLFFAALASLLSVYYGDRRITRCELWEASSFEKLLRAPLSKGRGSAPTASPHATNTSFISERFYAKLVILFVEIAKFTGSQPPLSNSGQVKAQKVAKEREERGGG